MNIIEFMHNLKVYEHYSGEWKLVNIDRLVFLKIEDNLYPIANNVQFIDLVEKYTHTEIRVCDECGCPMDAGYMNDSGWWHTCEECFPIHMDRVYGRGRWRDTDGIENDEGGYFEYFENGEWHPDGSFYTEWF